MKSRGKTCYSCKNALIISIHIYCIEKKKYLSGEEAGKRCEKYKHYLENEEAV